MISDDVIAKGHAICVLIDLLQVDSLIFLLMARYIGTIKKLERAEPRNKPNIMNKPSSARTGNRAKDFEKV